MTYSTSFRFTKGDEELKEYLNRNGIKPGIVKLFEFYKAHQEQASLESIIKTTFKDMMGMSFKPQEKMQTQDKKEVSKAGLSLFGGMKVK